MEIPILAAQLAPEVIKEIQRHYLDKRLIKTDDCVNDMLRDQLTEADVEKVIMDATVIEKVMPATSSIASSPKNTHYVIQGECTKGRNVYCKVCTNYHPGTGEFIEWRHTSFCISRK